MIEQGVTKAICREWIQYTADVRLVDGPVLAKLFGAEDEHFFVARFEKLDDSERLEGLTQTNAIRENAPVEGEKFADGSFDAVFLEVIECLPDPALKEAGALKAVIERGFILEEMLENVKERFVVDEIRGVVAVELLQIAENLSFHIAD